MEGMDALTPLLHGRVPRNLVVMGETYGGDEQAPTCSTKSSPVKGIKEGTCEPAMVRAWRSRGAPYAEINSYGGYNASWLKWQGMIPQFININCLPSGDPKAPCDMRTVAQNPRTSIGGAGAQFAKVLPPFDNSSVVAKAAEALKDANYDDTNASSVLVANMGDEIRLSVPCYSAPVANSTHQMFVEWGRQLGFADSSALGCSGAWDTCQCNASFTLVMRLPGDLRPPPTQRELRLFYHSNLFDHDYGVWQMRNLTSVYKQSLPNVRIGANFAPIYAGQAECPNGKMGCAFNFLGVVSQWIKPFREGALTLPWGEDSYGRYYHLAAPCYSDNPYKI